MLFASFMPHDINYLDRRTNRWYCNSQSLGSLVNAMFLLCGSLAAPMGNIQEGTRDLQMQTSSNAVPRIGRRADVPSFTSGFLPDNLPNFLKSDFARLGKRGIPRFVIPMEWKAQLAKMLHGGRRQQQVPASLLPFKRSPWTSSWANLMFKPSSVRTSSTKTSGGAGKRSARPMDSWSSSWADILRSPQGFRLHDGGNDYLSNTVMYKKRSEQPLVSSLNNVPLLGKRSGEEPKPESNVEMLVRVPREGEKRDKRDPEVELMSQPVEVEFSSRPVDEGFHGALKEKEEEEDPWGSFIGQEDGGLMSDVSLVRWWMILPSQPPAEQLSHRSYSKASHCRRFAKAKMKKLQAEIFSPAFSIYRSDRPLHVANNCPFLKLSHGRIGQWVPRGLGPKNWSRSTPSGHYYTSPTAYSIHQLWGPIIGPSWPGCREAARTAPLLDEDGHGPHGPQQVRPARPPGHLATSGIRRYELWLSCSRLPASWPEP